MKSVFIARSRVIAAALAALLGTVAPAAAQDTISSLDLAITTGADDLRGGGVAYGQIFYADGRSEPRVSLNNGQGWGNGALQRATMRLSRPMAPSALNGARLVISHDGAGRNFGETYDNWNVNRVAVTTPEVCAGGDVLGRSPAQRFTGQRQQLTVPIAAPAERRGQHHPALSIAIVTGNDDLRGGALLYAQVRLRDGRTLPEVNLNGGRQLSNRAAFNASLTIPAGVTLGAIESVVLRHDGAGRNVGETYDNWNLRVATIATPRACTSLRMAEVSGNPWTRFTGQLTSREITLAAP